MSAADVTSLAPPPGGPVAVVEHDRRRGARVLESPLLIIGAVILVFWILCAILQSHITPDDPFAPIYKVFDAPSRHHLFGTDRLGRDVLSRVLAGPRDLLVVAPLATALGTVIGTVIGLVTGYFGKLIDEVVNRLVDAVLALPLIITAVIVVNALGRSKVALVVVIGAIFAPIISRTVRSAVLQERGLDYVQAAKLRGERAPYILFVEILPNVLGPIVVEFTVRLGYAIFTIASLSFLNLGLEPPSPDWSLQIFTQYTDAQTAWWAVLFPSLAIASLVIAVNLVAEGMREMIDQ